MTDDELRELVAANSRGIERLEGLQEENARLWQQQREENRAAREESERRWQQHWEENRAAREENARQWEENRAAREENARQWQQQWEENRAAREENARLWQQQWEENRAAREENVRLWQQQREEIRASRVEMDRVITSIEKRLDAIHKELGGIGKTLGGVSEGLCGPAVDRIIRERFHMTQVGFHVKSGRNGRWLELDVFAHANDRIRKAYVAEIKTTLDEEAINQLHNQLRQFPEFFPHHRGKELYGILAAVNAPEEWQEKVLKDGIYLVRASADAFELCEPEGFRPRVFPNP